MRRAVMASALVLVTCFAPAALAAEGGLKGLVAGAASVGVLVGRLTSALGGS